MLKLKRVLVEMKVENIFISIDHIMFSIKIQVLPSEAFWALTQHMFCTLMFFLGSWSTAIWDHFWVIYSNTKNLFNILKFLYINIDICICSHNIFLSTLKMTELDVWVF